MKKIFLTGSFLFLSSLALQAQVKIGANPTQIINGAKLQINGTNTSNVNDPNTLIFYHDYTDPKPGSLGEGARLGIGTTLPSTTLEVASQNTNGTAIAIRNYSFSNPFAGHNWYLKSIGTGDSGLAGSFMIYDASASDGNTTGCNRLFINSFGKVGIGGIYNPEANLEIRNSGPVSTDNDRTTLSLNNAHKWILNSEGLSTSNPGSFLIWDATTNNNTGANRFIIKANGNVGIGGVYAPEANLEIRNGLEDSGIQINQDNDKTTIALNNANRWVISSEGIHTQKSGAFIIWDATTSRPGFVIDSNGRAAIGTTDTPNGIQLNVAGEIRASAISGPSDKRFKKNIEPLENALSKVTKLKGYTYEWRRDEFPDKNFKSGTDMGLIAQEVEKIYPEVVRTADDAMKSKSIDYTKLVPALIEAIKELQKEVEELKSQMPNQKR